jgi:ketopantoate reductase
VRSSRRYRQRPFSLLAKSGHRQSRKEIDAWTGAVVRLGARLGVPTPLHSFLYACLLPLERRALGELTFA